MLDVLLTVYAVLATIVAVGLVIRNVRVKTRLETLEGILAPDKHHQRSPNMRLVEGQKYCRLLRAWF